MTIEVTKEDLIYLLKGIYPGYSIMEELQEKGIGRYSDSRGWWWEEDLLSSMTEDQLFTLYNRCKASLTPLTSTFKNDNK